MQSTQIQYGDTLSKLANKYGTTVAELLKLNPNIKDPNKIYAGQALVVPQQNTSQGGAYTYNGKSYATGTGPVNQQQTGSYVYNGKSYANGTGPLAGNQQSTYQNPGPGVGISNPPPASTYTPPVDTSYQTTNYTPPSTPTQDNSLTGNQTLDEMLGEVKKYLDGILASGKTVNPNIELTPAEVQGFLDQAETEISPYYKSQFSSIKSDLKSNLDFLQKNYDMEVEKSKSDFTKSLETTRENAAGTGTVFSGGRARAEQDLATTQNRALEQYGLKTAETARSLATTAERSIGSRNLSDLSMPSFGVSTASTSGKGAFTPSRTLNYYTPSDTVGSLEREKLTAQQTRAADLEKAARNSRALNFY